MARKAKTSRPTLSAYEHGQKNPTLETLERILRVNGQQLTLTPTPKYKQHVDKRGKPFFVPNQLPYLPPEMALREVALPIHLDWSTPGKQRSLAVRPQRILIYQIVLLEGLPRDISTYVDGTLLVEAWSDMYLPVVIRRAWQPLIDQIIAKT